MEDIKYVKDIKTCVDENLHNEWKNNINKEIEELDHLDICKTFPYPINLSKSQKFPEVIYSKELFPIFNCICIETTSWCNCKCFFCPNPKLDREHFFMDENLFKKIIDDLSLMNYRSEVRLYQSNEPLLDKNIIEKVKYVKTKLPKAPVGFQTNGVLLRYELLEKLYNAGLNFMAVEAYHSEKEFNNYLEMFSRLAKEHSDVVFHYQDETGKYSYANEKSKYKNKGFYVTLSRRYKVEKYNKVSITSRVGTVDCSTKKCKNTNICTRPFRTMQVNWNGKVVVCCEEWLYGDGSIVGDLNKNTVSEVWNGKLYMNFRYKLQNGIRDEYPCNKCNYGGGIYTQNIRRVKL